MTIMSSVARRIFGVAALVIGMLMEGATSAHAGPAGRIARRVTLATERFTRAEWARIAKLDRAAHRVAETKVLARPQTVSRYVSKARARVEAQRGFGAGTHFTTGVHRGRPLSATAARERYGLRRPPQAVETVTLPAGTQVKKAKVHGGSPGWGEWTLVKRLRSAATRVRARAIP